jgi:(S)-citramalyl-CoA lyase
MSTTSARRCLLFVPGNRPERYQKAIQSGADMVCIDLEDATPLAEKQSARTAALTFAAQYQGTTELVIRANSLRSAEGLADVLAFRQAACQALLMLAKVEAATEVEIAAQVLGLQDARLIALLESAQGIERAFEIAHAPKLVALMFGGADYCAELGAKMSSNALLYPRTRTAAAAASRGLFAIDVPFLDIHDHAGIISETQQVAALGISCKSAIHPAQVAPIQATLRPSESEITQAQALLTAFHASPHAAIAYQGQLIDRPIVLAAQRVLMRAGLAT